MAAVLSVFGCRREDIELGPGLSTQPPLAPVPVPMVLPDAQAPIPSEPPDAQAPEPPRDAMTALPPVVPSVPEAIPSVPDDTPAQPEDCSASIPEGLLGARPPMGWNGYNAFGCDSELDETKLKAIVKAMIDSGMQSAGYHYVNLDSCWQLERTEDGERVIDTERLPGGIEALSEWVHDLGFGFGFYSHIQDCQQMAGGAGFEEMDVASYVAWGVDYLKYVPCGTGGAELRGAVEDLAAVLAQADRRIVLSLAAPPFQEWMRDSVQLWRTSGVAAPTWSSIVAAIDATVPLAAYARPGAFNDPDMLEIGNGDLTAGEKRAQLSVWSVLSAPLLAGNDLTDMTEETRAILTNSDVIAIDQDPLGLQGTLVRREGNVELLAKPLAACGARAAVLWNRGTTTTNFTVTWEDVWLEPDAGSARDLWSDTELDATAQGVSVTVPGHDAVALRIQGTEPPLPKGRVYLSDLPWTYVTNGFGPVELDRTNGEDEPLDGAPIRLRGAAYEKGLGVHAPSLIRYRLGQKCSRFAADVGIDDDVDGKGSVQFEVWADGERLFQSGRVTGTSPTQSVDVDIRGRRELRLFVGMGGDNFTLDHSLWAGATLECDP